MCKYLEALRSWSELTGSRVWRRASLTAAWPLHGHLGTNERKLDVRGRRQYSDRALSGAYRHGEFMLPRAD